jgi:hypothetical protein
MVGNDYRRLAINLPSVQGSEKTAGIITRGAVEPEFMLDVHYIRFDQFYRLVYYFIPAVTICVDNRMDVPFAGHTAIRMTDDVDFVSLHAQRLDQFS